jgi:hypothetical protein
VLSNATLALYGLTLQHLRNSLGNLSAAALGIGPGFSAAFALAFAR